MSQWEQVFLAVIVSIVAGVQLTAMLFYMLIFPLINKFFNKSFPCYDFSITCDDWMNGYFRQTLVKLEVEKAIMARREVKSPLVDDKKPARFVDVHKDVETVRLPKVVANPENADEKLTLSKIDFAARHIVNPNEQKPTPQAVRAQKPIKETPPVTKEAVAKRPTKAIKKDETVETFELNLPTSAPEMNVKKTEIKTTASKPKPVKRVGDAKKEDSTIQTVEIPVIQGQGGKDDKK